VSATRRIGRAVARRAAAPVLRARVARESRAWAPYTRLAPVAEAQTWAIEQEMRELARTAGRLGVPVAPAAWAPHLRAQSIFHGSQFALLRPERFTPANRHALAFLHGRPGTPGEPALDEVWANLAQLAPRLDRVQVTHVEIAARVVDAGVPAERVFEILLAVNLELFARRDDGAYARAREALGIRREAFVVGSFQKDGVGWGEGLEPKLIKGPDVLLAALERARAQVPGLHVLLSGPARGYVIRGLERLGIPYVHRYLDRYEEIGGLYAALDAYLVSSRQEGGPKAVLESMATGVPVVSTRVGQATALVEHGRNGWLADVEDAEGLANLLAGVAGAGAEDLRAIADAGRRTAEANSYEAQLPLWRALLDGFVELP
jgi:glycosyltransferase involved in cell wall biosynthesis